MKGYLNPIFALTTIALLAAGNIQADTEEKMIIALKTDDFEMTETDVSSLAIGESQTIETDSGKVIDLLRTADGMEIYVDGELLEMSFDSEGLHEESSHGGHMIEKHVEIVCDNDEECDKNVFVMKGDDTDISSFVTDSGENIIIHKEVELTCTTEDDGTSCSDEMIWVSDGEDIDLKELHEMHMDGEGEGHKVIMIRKHVVTED
jgi:hypothetical protein